VSRDRRWKRGDHRGIQVPHAAGRVAYGRQDEKTSGLTTAEKCHLEMRPVMMLALGDVDLSSECGEDAALRKKTRLEVRRKLTITSLTKEMLEMVPSTRHEGLGQHGALITVASTLEARLRHANRWRSPWRERNLG
jgi:hypothetical protein